LNQLVQAEAQGKVESFALESGIGLENGHVRVIIECAPDNWRQPGQQRLTPVPR